MTRGKKVVLFGAGIIVLALAVVFVIRYYMVFGEGVKTGELNYVVKKGYIFKTYEGKMIQSGFQTSNNEGIHSNEFIFSIEDQEIADSLMKMQAGREVALHYKEYLGMIPWRGYSRYVVDKIVSIRSTNQKNVHPEIPYLEGS